MREHFIGGSEIADVLRRQDGVYVVYCENGMTYQVPNQEGNADFHTLQVWEEDGGLVTVITEVEKSGANYTITTEDGRTITCVSNREDPSLHEQWVQIWSALGGVVSGS